MIGVLLAADYGCTEYPEPPYDIMIPLIQGVRKQDFNYNQLKVNGDIQYSKRTIIFKLYPGGEMVWHYWEYLFDHPDITLESMTAKRDDDYEKILNVISDYWQKYGLKVPGGTLNELD